MKSNVLVICTRRATKTLQEIFPSDRQCRHTIISCSFCNIDIGHQGHQSGAPSFLFSLPTYRVSPVTGAPLHPLSRLLRPCHSPALYNYFPALGLYVSRLCLPQQIIHPITLGEQEKSSHGEVVCFNATTNQAALLRTHLKLVALSSVLQNPHQPPRCFLSCSQVDWVSLTQEGQRQVV